MEGLGQLIIFSIVMLIGSYGAGSAPLCLPLSEEKLHMISVLGAGLLVGVAFSVIIPEGVLALIKAYSMKSESNHDRSSAIVSSPGGSADQPTNQITAGSHDHHEHSLEGLDRLMGMSLVLGFIFMMFVEQLASYISNRGNNRLPTTDSEALVQSSGNF